MSNPLNNNRFLPRAQPGGSGPVPPHAPTHEDGGSDEVTAQNLGSGGAAVDQVMVTDGAGGWVLEDKSTGATKEIFYFADLASNDGAYRVRNILTNGSFRFDFKVPHDFTSLVTLALVGWPEPGAAGAGKDIDLTSEYGSVGELRNNHSESDVGSTYNLGATDVIFELDISGVFSSLAAGDYAGLLVSHNSIGGTVHYLGIRLRYS